MDWKKGQQCLMILMNGLTRGERVFLFTPSSSNCHIHDFCYERINRDNSRFKKSCFHLTFSTLINVALLFGLDLSANLGLLWMLNVRLLWSSLGS